MASAKAQPRGGFTSYTLVSNIVIAPPFPFSSPAAPQGRFVFGGNQDNMASGETLLATQSQGALGMDDTRMDLSQFDDSSQGGRSAPQTPRARTPPTISITEAPTGGDQEEVGAEDADIVAEVRRISLISQHVSSIRDHCIIIPVIYIP